MKPHPPKRYTRQPELQQLNKGSNRTKKTFPRLQCGPPNGWGDKKWKRTGSGWLVVVKKSTFGGVDCYWNEWGPSSSPLRYLSPGLMLTEYLWHLPTHKNNHRLLQVDSFEKKKQSIAISSVTTANVSEREMYHTTAPLQTATALFREVIQIQYTQIRRRFLSSN